MSMTKTRPTSFRSNRSRFRRIRFAAPLLLAGAWASCGPPEPAPHDDPPVLRSGQLAVAPGQDLLQRPDVVQLGRAQRQALTQLLAASRDTPDLLVNAEGKTIAQVRGRFTLPSSGAPGLLELVTKYATALGVADRLTSLTPATTDDPSGATVRLDQTVAGLTVFGGGVVAHTDETGAVLEICSQVTPTEGIPTKPSVSPAAAAAVAAQLLGKPASGLKPRLVVIDGALADAAGGPGKLAWLFEVQTPAGTQRIFVDAQSGSLLLNYFASAADDQAQRECPSNPLPRYHDDPATHVPDFVSFGTTGLWLPESSTHDAARTALAFFQRHPLLYGTGDVSTQLQVVRVEPPVSPTYMPHVVLQQMYAGIPVLGAELRVHLTPAFAVGSISGHYLWDPEVVPVPRVSEPQALGAAVSRLRGVRQAQGNFDDPATEVSSLGLVVYPGKLANGPGGTNALAYGFRFPEADLFVADAPGEGATHVIAVHPNLAGARRVIEDAGTAGLLSFPATVSVDGNANGSAWNPEVAPGDAFLAGTLKFYAGLGRTSYDNANSDAVLVTNTTLGPFSRCPNAMWDFVRHQMWFCSGMVADDVVAHELTHGVTMATAQLTYLDESGALNEHYSDVLGVLAFPDAPGVWTIGEATGIVRDLKNSFTSAFGMVTPLPANYAAFVRRGPGCTAPLDVLTNPLCDMGGVHTNSAIGNRAAVLLGEGQAGTTHAGVGRDLMAPVFLETLTRRLHPWANYLNERLNSWQSARDLAARGVLVMDSRLTPPALVGFGGVADEVGWAFTQVGVDPRLDAGWHSVDLGGSGTIRRSITMYAAQSLPPCFNVGDVELIAEARDPFGGQLPWWTGRARLSDAGGATVTFPGGMFGAMIAKDTRGTTSREVTIDYFHNGFVPFFVDAYVTPAADPSQPGCAVSPPGGGGSGGGGGGTPVLPTISETVTPGTSHWSVIAGGKGDDMVNAGRVMKQPDGTLCPITDVFLELLDQKGSVAASTSAVAAPMFVKYGPFGWFSWGGLIASANLGTPDPMIDVHWWFDIGSAMRYQVRYFSVGTSCAPM